MLHLIPSQPALYTPFHNPTEQGILVFYLELVTNMLHLVVYLVFFTIVFNKCVLLCV